MPQYVDMLTTQLFVLGFAGLILIYITVDSYMQWRKGKSAWPSISAGQIPLAVFGFYALVSGLYGQFFWPLPGSYNILFYDVYPLFGLFLISAAWSIHSKLKTQYVGFFALLLGLMTMYYGLSGYNLGLTQAPIALLGLYVLFGIGGVLGYAVTVMFDRAEEKVKNRWVGWKLILLAFGAMLLCGSLLALFIGVSAIPAHLASPP